MVTKPIKKKAVSTFSSYEKRIKRATSLNELSTLYARIKLCNAMVGDFDFKTDFDFYNHMVRGHIKTCRGLCKTRFLAGQESSARNLKEDKWKEARFAYNKAYIKWIKKEKVIYSYPKHFVGIKKGIAFFSKKKPKEVTNPFGTKSKE